MTKRICSKFKKKSRIRETKNLLIDADSRTNTILEKLHDFLVFFFWIFCVIIYIYKYIYIIYPFFIEKKTLLFLERLRAKKKLGLFSSSRGSVIFSFFPPGTHHVTSGPIKDLKKKLHPMSQTNGHGNSMNESA